VLEELRSGLPATRLLLVHHYRSTSLIRKRPPPRTLGIAYCRVLGVIAIYRLGQERDLYYYYYQRGPVAMYAPSPRLSART
jgi:hypothetical protein